MEDSKLNLMNNFVDIFQIGARNMQNFPLISKTAKFNKPIIIKATIPVPIEILIVDFGSSNHSVLCCFVK